MSMSCHFFHFHPTSATSRIDVSCPIDASCPSHLRDLLLNTLHLSLPMQLASFMYISLRWQTSFLQHGARLVSWIELGVLVRADWKCSWNGVNSVTSKRMAFSLITTHLALTMSKMRRTSLEKGHITSDINQLQEVMLFISCMLSSGVQVQV